ncbi:MAG: acyl carrier protein [Bacteroidales bacterium]
MEQLVEQLKELLEVDALDMKAKFVEMEEWDSLASLSIIALLDSDYGMTMNHADIVNFSNIGDFCQFVLEHKK